MTHLRYRSSGALVSGWLIGLLWCSTVIYTNDAATETLVAGMVGYTVASDTSQGTVTDPQNVGLPAGTPISGVNLNNSLMYGMKLGRYFNSVPWLGVEIESFMTTPQRPAQDLMLSVPRGGGFTVQEPGATNRVIVVSPNLLVRYRAGSFEP